MWAGLIAGWWLRRRMVNSRPSSRAAGIVFNDRRPDGLASRPPSRTMDRTRDAFTGQALAPADPAAHCTHCQVLPPQKRRFSPTGERRPLRGVRDDVHFAV
jgi:hypothetical protein